MGSIVVVGTAFVDIKGFPDDAYLPNGRNAGRIEYIHGGVGRNVVEDIANMELRPTYVGLVDESPMGRDVLEKLRRHKVNVDYVVTTPDGMGTWLAVFDHNGDVAGSISKRPDTRPLIPLLEEHGDEIFSQADSVVLQADIDRDVVKKCFELAEKYGKKVYSIVSNNRSSKSLCSGLIRAHFSNTSFCSLESVISSPSPKNWAKVMPNVLHKISNVGILGVVFR